MQRNVGRVGVDRHGVGHEPVVEAVVHVPVKVQDLAGVVDLDCVLVDQCEADVAEGLAAEVLVSVVEGVCWPASSTRIRAVANDTTTLQDDASSAVA
jgi:hypothetical protein